LEQWAVVYLSILTTVFLFALDNTIVRLVYLLFARNIPPLVY
jgi:hypothetical protein